MKQVNAIIDCDVRNLCRGLATIQARVGSYFVGRVVNAPDDVTDLTVRISNAGGTGFYDIPCSENGNGDWRFAVIGTVFSAACEQWYELRAKSAAGYDTAIGRGRLKVCEFSASSGTATPTSEEKRVVQTILDASGGQHQIVAVYDAENNEWTYQIGDTVE